MSTIEGSLRDVPKPRGGALAGAGRRLAFWALSRLDVGALELVLPDGSSRRFGPGDRALRVEVVSDAFFERIARRSPKLSVGEAFVAGDWRTDDLPGVLELLMRNAELASARPPFRQAFAALERLPRIGPRNGPRRAKDNIAYHYDLGNDLFRLFLDETMTYSCAYFETGEETLEEAQTAKYERICAKLGLGPGDRVLEIGCGWGGFALHAAGRHGAHVTGLTISPEQARLARERVAAAGLADRVDIVERDYRLVEGRFDRIVSIEMLEAIGDRQYGTFFATCDRLLAPAGTACVQTIAIPDNRWQRYRRTRDWVQRYVFPGSVIPSVAALAKAMARSSALQIHGLEEIGVGYAETLRRWRERFLESAEAVHALGYDEHFCKTWEFYLAGCEAGFRTRALRDVQLVLSRPFNDALPAHPTLRTTY